RIPQPGACSTRMSEAVHGRLPGELHQVSFRRVPNAGVVTNVGTVAPGADVLRRTQTLFGSCAVVCSHTRSARPSPSVSAASGTLIVLKCVTPVDAFSNADVFGFQRE